ncbi:hypothetical protein EON77_22320 [bacterium]|nr:MAG: hypothetical protein EON77_22320 [bacterium]
MRLLRGTSSDALPLTLACVFVFASLCAITVAGTFTVDESHYLATIEALRGGTFRLESTRALSPSIELLSFGAYAYLIGGSMPVAPVAPPLYAFVALPFSMFGFRALIVLNTLSFVLTGVLVFRLAKYQASRRITAWGALLLFWFGGFSLEYAVVRSTAKLRRRSRRPPPACASASPRGCATRRSSSARSSRSRSATGRANATASLAPRRASPPSRPAWSPRSSRFRT